MIQISTVRQAGPTKHSEIVANFINRINNNDVNSEIHEQPNYVPTWEKSKIDMNYRLFYVFACAWKNRHLLLGRLANVMAQIT